MKCRLDLVDGLRVMKSFPLMPDEPSRIGRSAQNAIRLNDDRVSRRHCLLTLRDGHYILQDLGSHNGTKVNGQFVTEHTLEEGDQIVLGNTMLVFREMAGSDTAEKKKPDTAEMEAAKEEIDQSVVRAVLRQDDSRFLNTELLDAISGDNIRTASTLKALYKVTSAVLSAKSINELLDQLLDLVFESLKVDRAIVLLADDEGVLQPRAMKQRGGESSKKIEVSRSIANRSFEENIAILSQDAQTDSRFASQESIVMQGVRSAMCVPIGSHQRTWGVLYVDRKTAVSTFTEEQLDFLMAVARQAGLALENLHLAAEQRKTFESMIRTLAASIDAKDPVTAGHSDRVARYSMALADRLGLPREEKRILRLAAYLHDYGKIGVRDAVLLKPSSLTPEEYEEIKAHPRFTGELLSKIHFGQEMQGIPLVAMSHHERVDGTGYPNGLGSDEIPQGSKIIAIADIWDALTSPRQYKKGWSLDDAIRELKGLKGTYLDPDLVDIFLSYVDDEIRPQSSDGKVPGRKRIGPFGTGEFDTKVVRLPDEPTPDPAKW